MLIYDNFLLKYHNQKDVIIMMGRKRSFQSKLFYHRINLEKRVRRDHVLRMIEQNIDFDFVYKEVEHQWFFDSCPEARAVACDVDRAG